MIYRCYERYFYNGSQMNWGVHSMLHNIDLRRSAFFMNKKIDPNRPPSSNSGSGNKRDSMVRETFVLPRDQARIQARQWLESFPAAAYWSRVETWKELDDGSIKFTMVRLPNAD